MALDKNDLLSLIAANFPDNTSQEITPAKARQVLEQMVASDANLEEVTDQTFLGNLAFPNKFDPKTDMVIERLLEAVSLATSQQPAGLGIANAIQVEFGVAQGTGSSPVQIDVNGTLTFNEAGLMRIKAAFEVGRTGASSTSLVLIRYLVNGVQIGRTVATKITNSDDITYIESDNWFNVPIGTTLEVEVMRDNSGDNSGGLFSTVPTDEGAGTWMDSPSAIIRVERLVLAP